MATVAEIRRELTIPKGVTASLAARRLAVKGPKGNLERLFSHPRVAVTLHQGGGGQQIVVSTTLPGRREKALVGTWEAHAANMIRGVTQGFSCKMKIVYAHFPIKVSVKGDIVVIENFLGERTPRSADVVRKSKVEIAGDAVTVTSPDIEAAGQTAANIELATRVKGFDPRVFQDGIYIVQKAA